MLVKLDEVVESMLCCPLCKGNLAKGDSKFFCECCGVVYSQRTVGKTGDLDHVFDFSIQETSLCQTPQMAKWSETQAGYEKGDVRRKRRDELEKYLEEIDSVREIYTQEFFLAGAVLDVGGSQGRVRHFFTDQVSLYVSADPYLNTFERVISSRNLLKAYPVLKEPCNFLVCHAENLPFRNKSFDWVHMRSVLDHFYNPYRAIVEAYRVLKDNGKLLVGQAVTREQLNLKVGSETGKTYVSPIVAKTLRLFKSLGLIKAAKYELKTFSRKPPGDKHMRSFGYEDLVGLFRNTNFEIRKEHWQKPPYDSCIYIAAAKRPPIL